MSRQPVRSHWPGHRGGCGEGVVAQEYRKLAWSGWIGVQVSEFLKQGPAGHSRTGTVDLFWGNSVRNLLEWGLWRKVNEEFPTYVSTEKV